MFSERVVKLLPGGRVKKALKFFNKGNYRRACDEFEAVLKSASGDANSSEMAKMYLVESLVEYAKQLASDGKYKLASEKLEKAVSYEPGYADVHYFLATIYEHLGEKEKAVSSFGKALDINPNFFRARIFLARCYFKSGENMRAVDELNVALKVAPNFFVDDVRELIVLVRNNEKKASEEIFLKLIEEMPSSAQVAKEIAIEALQNGDVDSAIAELKKTLSMNPDYPDLHNLLGIALSNKGMIDDAILEFKTALKIHPDYLKARLNLALSYYEKGAIEETVENLKLVLKLDPGNELAINLMDEVESALKR